MLSSTVVEGIAVGDVAKFKDNIFVVTGFMQNTAGRTNIRYSHKKGEGVCMPHWWHFIVETAKQLEEAKKAKAKNKSTATA